MCEAEGGTCVRSERVRAIREVVLLLEGVSEMLLLLAKSAGGEIVVPLPRNARD